MDHTSYRPGSRRSQVAFSGILLLAAAIVLTATLPHGAWLSPDSVGYLGMARSLLDSGAFSDFLGQPVTMQPPLYPLLLAAPGKITGGEIMPVLPWLNAGLYCLAIFLFASLARRTFGQWRPALIMSAVAVISSPLVESAVSVLSEMLYIVVILSFMIFLIDYCSKPGLAAFAMLVVAASLAPLVRYVGVTVLATGVATILLAPSRPLKQRLVLAVLFGALASAPLCFWWARNYRLAHNLTGERAASMFSLPQNLEYFAATLVGWFVPKRVQIIPRYIPVASLFLVLGLLCLSLPRSRRSLAAAHPDKGPGSWSIPVAVPAILFAFHSTFLIVTSTTTAYDIIADRLMVPVYPCFLLLLGAAPLRCLVKYALLTVLLAVSLLKSAKLVHDGAFHGKGFQAVEWRESPLIHYIISSPRSRQIYSNIADVIYLRTGEKTAWLPRKFLNHMTLEKAGPPSSVLLGQMQSNYIVYYQPGTNLWYPYLCNPDEMKQWLTIKKVAAFDDGAVYQVVGLARQ